MIPGCLPPELFFVSIFHIKQFLLSSPEFLVVAASSSALNISLAGILVFYFLFICLISFGWLRVKKFGWENHQSERKYLSIIVAFRNEACNLPALIASVKQLNYPVDYYELLLVNDHSDDHSVLWLEKNLPETINISLLHLPENSAGKKAALKYAAKFAKGEILVFTDADCRFGPYWLQTHNAFFQKNPDVALAIGLVDYLPERQFLTKLFRLDFLSLILSGAGMAGFGRPVMCNGANFAVRRNDYLAALKTHDFLASGDDVFLLHEIKSIGKKAKLLKSNENLVSTHGPANFRDFAEQRIRWGSKAGFYRDKDMLLLLFTVIVSNLAFVIGITRSIFMASNTLLFWILSTKIAADTILFLCGFWFFRLKWNIIPVPFIAILHPFYLLLFSLISIKRPFQWKGRILNK